MDTALWCWSELKVLHLDIMVASFSLAILHVVGLPLFIKQSILEVYVVCLLFGKVKSKAVAGLWNFEGRVLPLKIFELVSWHLSDRRCATKWNRLEGCQMLRMCVFVQLSQCILCLMLDVQPVWLFCALHPPASNMEH